MNLIDLDTDFQIEELTNRIEKLENIVTVLENKLNALIEDKYPYRNVLSAFEVDSDG